MSNRWTSDAYRVLGGGLIATFICFWFSPQAAGTLKIAISVAAWLTIVLFPLFRERRNTTLLRSAAVAIIAGTMLRMTIMHIDTISTAIEMAIPIIWVVGVMYARQSKKVGRPLIVSFLSCPLVIAERLGNQQVALGMCIVIPMTMILILVFDTLVDAGLLPHRWVNRREPVVILQIDN